MEADAEAIVMSEINALDKSANPVQAYLDNVQ